MEKRCLGQQGLRVSAIGLGCMGMSFAYGFADQDEALRTLACSLETGIDFWDTAEIYGPFANEELLGKALKGQRHKVTVATKFAWRLDAQGVSYGIDGGVQNMKRALEGSLKRLKTEYIDLFYLHRVDTKISIEETVAGMAALVKEGKVRYIGLSKVTAETIRKAHSVYPLSVVQNEYSLWEKSVEREVLPVLRELGIGFVAYSPLGCGFLTGKVRCTEDLRDDDFRRTSPRFQNDSIKKNWELITSLETLAVVKQASFAQLAIAWLLYQGKSIVPLPGISRVSHLKENILALKINLSQEDIQKMNTVSSRVKIAGKREAGDMLKFLKVSDKKD